MRTILIVPLLIFWLNASGQSFEYFCVAKHAAWVGIKSGSNGHVFESDSGTTDIQWIIAKGKVRSLDNHGEIPCENLEKSIYCIKENTIAPYFVVSLDDNTFIYHVEWKPTAGGTTWMVYAGNCVPVPADEETGDIPSNEAESWTLSLYARGGTLFRLKYPSMEKCLSAGESYIADESAERFDCGLNCEDSIDLTTGIRCERVCNSAGCR